MAVYIEYGNNEIKSAIKILEKVKPKIREGVLIKPNLTMPASPESNICTSPKVVEGVVNYLRNIGIEDIVIGEGAGGAKDMGKYFERTGYKGLSERLNVPLIDLNKDKSIELKVKRGYFLDNIKIAKTAYERYVINVPKMKTHRLAVATLGLKNMMGVILPYNKKLILHPVYNEINEKIKLEGRTCFSEEELKEAQENFFKGLADFYSAYKPDLTIIDAVIGKEGDGLTHGRDINMNCILLSESILDIDYVGAYLMGLHLPELYLQYIGGNKPNNIGDVQIISDIRADKLIKKFEAILLTEKIA